MDSPGGSGMFGSGGPGPGGPNSAQGPFDPATGTRQGLSGGPAPFSRPPQGQGPLPPVGGGTGQGLLGAQPSPALSGEGQSPQNMLFGRPPQPVQPANAVQNQVPPVNPAVAALKAQPVQPSSYQVQNQMMGQAPAPLGQARAPQAPPSPMQVSQVPSRAPMQVHNPTGTGADTASQVAAAKRPIPGNYPKKKQGLMPPEPMPGRGGKA